jgi:hypothetical protein
MKDQYVLNAIKVSLDAWNNNELTDKEKEVITIPLSRYRLFKAIDKDKSFNDEFIWRTIMHLPNNRIDGELYDEYKTRRKIQRIITKNRWFLFDTYHSTAKTIKSE